VDRNTLPVAVIVLLITVIIIEHVAISVLVWRRFSWGVSLLLLIALSAVTSVIWFFTASAFFLLFLWSSDARGIQYDLYFSTFDLLIHPCSGVPRLRELLGPSLCRISPYFIGPFVFFIASLLVVAPRIRGTDNKS
jgi:hypothetical protein